MKSNGGGWRRVVELVAGTFVGLWGLVLVMELAGGGSGNQASYRLGQLAVWVAIFAIVRQSRIKKQKADAVAASLAQMPPPQAQRRP